MSVATMTTALQQLIKNASIEFYGDGITAGTNLIDAKTQRWSSLMCQKFGKTELNYCIAGDMIQDALLNVYTNHKSGTPVFLAYGTNDCTKLNNVMNIDELVSCYEALIVYCALPNDTASTNKWKICSVNSSYVTKSGTWTTAQVSPSVIGLSSNVIGSKLSAKVNGQFIVFDLIALVGYASTYAVVAVTIDGVSVNDHICIRTSLENGQKSDRTSILCIYDAQTTGDHIVQITVSNPVNAQSTLLVSPQSLYVIVSFIGAFDYNEPTANPVFIVSPWRFSYSNIEMDFQSGLNSILPSRIGPLVFMYIQKQLYDLCYKFKTLYGLPIFYIQSPNLSLINYMYDTLHPNVSGHKLIAQQISSLAV